MQNVIIMGILAIIMGILSAECYHYGDPCYHYGDPKCHYGDPCYHYGDPKCRMFFSVHFVRNFPLPNCMGGLSVFVCCNLQLCYILLLIKNQIHVLCETHKYKAFSLGSRPTSNLFCC